MEITMYGMREIPACALTFRDSIRIPGTEHIPDYSTHCHFSGLALLQTRLQIAKAYPRSLPRLKWVCVLESTCSFHCDGHWEPEMGLLVHACSSAELGSFRQ